MPTFTLNNKYISQGPNIVTTPFTLIANRSSIEAPYGGGTYITSVTTHPINPWMVTDSCTWISIVDGTGKGNGSFSIVIDERFIDETYDLSGRVTISSKAGDVHIDITQEPIPDSVVLTPDSCTFLTSGLGTEPVCVVDSFIAGYPRGWSAAVTEGSDYASVNPGSGQSGDQLCLTLDSNTGANPRNGVIEVSCGEAAAYFTFCQDGTSQSCIDAP